MSTLIALLCGIYLVAPLTAQEVRVGGVGIICPGDVTTGARHNAPGTTRGWTGKLKPGVVLDFVTRDVGYLRGVSFGVELKWTGSNVREPITMQVTRPASNGGYKAETYEATVRNDVYRPYVYTLKSDHRSLYGTWTFAAIHKSKKVVEEQFEFRRKDDIFDVKGLCSGELIVS